MATADLAATSHEPILGVKRKLWRRDDEHASPADLAFQSTRKAVLSRDDFTCFYCRFKAEKYQEVHHKDDDHKNNSEANLLTVCNLCHQVFHIGMCAMRGGGFFAAIPELTQTQVNNIARAILVGSLLSDKHCDKLLGLYAVLEYRGSNTLKRLYGVDISDPYVFAEILSLGDETLYRKRAALLSPLRLVPTKQSFHGGQIEYYANNHPDQFNPAVWTALSKQLGKR